MNHLLLHVLLSLKKFDLSFALQLILVLGSVALMLRLCLQSLSRFVAFLLNILRSDLLRVGVHLGPLRCGFMLYSV